MDVVNTVFGKGLFDICRGGIDGVPLKPAPDAVFAILDELGLSADEAIFVGDTKVDIETGKNADLFSVGVLWGFRDEAELKGAGADVIIDSPDQIKKIADSK